MEMRTVKGLVRVKGGGEEVVPLRVRVDAKLPNRPALVKILVIIYQEGHHKCWIYKYVSSVKCESKNKKLFYFFQAMKWLCSNFR